MKNPEAPEPTRTQAVSRFASRHAEVVCFALGILLGVLATTLGAVVR